MSFQDILASMIAQPAGQQQAPQQEAGTQPQGPQQAPAPNFEQVIGAMINTADAPFRAIGNGLDYAYDNTIGEATGTRDLFDGNDLKVIPKIILPSPVNSMSLFGDVLMSKWLEQGKPGQGDGAGVTGKDAKAGDE